MGHALVDVTSGGNLFIVLLEIVELVYMYGVTCLMLMLNSIPLRIMQLFYLINK